MSSLATQYPIVGLLLRRRPRFLRDFIFFVVVAGLGNAVVLAIVNAASLKALDAEANGWYLALYAIAVTAFLLAQYHIASASALEAERVMDTVRTDIARHIAHAELESLERIGHAQVFGCVNRDTIIVSQAAASAPAACQSVVMIGFSAIYLYQLSPMACVLTVVFAFLGLRAYVAKRDQWAARLGAAAEAQNNFVASLTHLLDGFKEVRLHADRSRDLLAQLHDISSTLRAIKSESERGFAEQYAFAQVAFYLLVGAVVFLLPRLSPAFPAVVMQATAAVLFITGPLSTLIGTIPLLARANAAAQSVIDLERALANAETHEPPSSRPVEPGEPIEVQNLGFTYEARGDEPGFSIGPLSFTVQPGRIVFLVGGNGSGKSTLLKVLAGLYHPQVGSVRMGTTPLTAATARWYRNHFTVIFSDFHLFDRLYGLRHVDRERVTAELTRVRLQNKVHIEDGGRFSTLDLSSGQRKRLALAVGLLEDRPVLVFDEWAAEQDPDFRRHFYEDILPSLRAEGRTIIAATHDDRYFKIADQIVKLEAGQVVAPPAARAE